MIETNFTQPDPKLQQIEKQKFKLRNLTLKLFFSDIDEETNNTDESFQSTIKTMKKHIQNSTVIENKKQEYEMIYEEMELFVDELRRSPAIWLKYIQNDKLQREGRNIILNTHISLTEVYQDIISNTNSRVKEKRKAKQLKSKNKDKESKVEDFDFQKSYFEQSTINLMAYILNNFSRQISMSFSEGKSFIVEQTKMVEQLLKQSKIMNTYILFALVKQMSKSSYKKIKEIFRASFPQIPQQITHQFCQFVQTNYQIEDLHYDQTKDVKIMDEKAKKKYYEDFNMNLIALLCQNTIESQIPNPNQNNQENKLTNEQAVKTLEEASKTNEKKLQQHNWKASEIQDSVKSVFGLLKNNVKGQFTASTDKQIASDLMRLEPASASIGGGLGKCLVDIDKFQSTNAFFTEFSKQAAIGGTIGIMLQQVPILNYFIIAGGLSYSVYINCKDQITSQLQKMKQIGKASAVAVGSVGTIVVGMVIGQIIIPIPFLGAFIGGVVGGYLGEKGSRKFTSIMNNHQFMKVVEYLLENIVQENHWDYDQDLLQILGISKKYFEKSISPKPQKNDAYVTALCFCVVAHYESRKQNEFTEKKMSQESQQKPDKQDQKLVAGEFVQNQFNIVKIVQYLTLNDITLIAQLPKLQSSTKHLLR